MVRLKGFFGKREVIAKHSQKVTVVQGQALWQPVIDALHMCLQGPLWHKANVRITVANSLVRYALLPWSETLLSAEEEKKFVKFKMDEVFGVSDKSFETSLAANSFGNPRLASAIETDLLNNLQQLAITSNLKIQSIQPQLVSALNFWRKEFKAKQLYFMFADGEKISTTFIKEGLVQHLRMEHISGEPFLELIESILHREHLMNHSMDSGTQVYLYASKKPQLTHKIANYQVQHLSLPVSYLNHPDAFLVGVYQA